MFTVFTRPVAVGGRVMRLEVLGVCTVSAVWMCVVGRPSPPPRQFRDVSTSQGAARGYLAPDPPHYAYYGIPYARPPTRRDRFKAPKPPPEWDGVFEATHKIKCPQHNADGEENCLVVNVFTPEEARAMPVIVFVHGGDFQHGWGAYQLPARLLSEGFVIVTFNYRLGALGFLCLDTPNAPGNAGLKDQISALYWVHRNIAKFGGNPRDVTVYGTGSGAASVQLILLSGLVKGLLHRVILESGSVLSPVSLSYSPLTVAYKGAHSIGYEETDEPEELYKFYQEAAAEDLVKIHNMFLPCVENKSDYLHSLIDLDPRHKLTKGSFYKVPILIAFTQKDLPVVKGSSKFESPPDSFEHLLPNNLDFENNKVKQGVGEIVKQFYFGEDSNNDNAAQSYADYIHDIFTEYPVMKVAVLFAAKNTYPVYVMKFTLPKEAEITEYPTPENFDSLLDYLYNADTKANEGVSDQIIMLLKNFIKIGDPTPLITTLVPLIWQPVDPDHAANKDISDIPILLFNSNKLQMGTTPMNQRLLFWDNIYAKFYKPYVLEQESEELDDND